MADSTKYSSKLTNTRVLIIGGSSGIGYAVAEACLEAGATVILSSSQESRIAASISSLTKTYPSAAHGRLSGHACDLSSPATLEDNIATLFSDATAGGTRELNHVIFTAGDKLAMMPLESASLAAIQQAGMVRFFAPILVAKHAARVLPKSPLSSYTMTTGSVSEHPMPNWAIINSYATGSHGMCRGLALDMKPVRVNLISPGGVETPLWDGMPRADYETLKKHMEEKTTTGVMGKPEDVAESYMYVLRDRNVSGSVISTNGGALLT
ncbi:hypothetical protein MMC19_003956 [Ptychographa xylographoides]|nr:hypothetical protein [Ptychographa xylographoides]